MAYMIYNQLGIKIKGPNGEYYPFQGIMQTTKNIVKLLFTDNSSMIVSRGHKFYCNGNEIESQNLKVNDTLDGFNCTKTIKEIEITEKDLPVYSPVEVQSDHKYVTSNGLINGNCSFIGSTSTLVSADILDKIVPKDPIDLKYGFSLKIWEAPKENAIYVMGVDAASGTGKDYAVIQVLKLESKDKFVQVACYSNNTIDAEHFANVVAEVSEWYNQALMIVENNEIGKTVADRIWYDLGCGNILCTDNNGKIGTRATKTSKLDACIELKRLIENNILELVDNETIKQLSRFEEISPNVFKGATNSHDDLVSGLYWACYCTMQPQIDKDNLTIQVKENDTATPEKTCFFEEDEDIWHSVLL